LRSLICSIIAALAAVVAGVLLQASSVSDLAPYKSPASGAFLPPMAVFKAATKISAFVDKVAFALKPPPVQIMSLLSGYQTTQAIGVFASMRIAEAMDKLNPEGMSEVKDIAAAVGADADALRRLLRLLSVLGVVASDGTPDTTLFGNSATSKMLIKDAPGSLWGAAISSSTNHYLGWTNMEASIKKGASTIAFDDKFKMNYWDYVKKRPEEEGAFAHFMTGVSMEPNAAIAMSGANFSECGAIVDVGGGHGSLLADIVAAFPALAGKATVIDLPSVTKSAPSRAGVAFQGGDFFNAKTLPRSASTNCYIAKVVLHDWVEDKAVAILKSVTGAMDAAAVPASARKVYLAEQILTEGDALAVPKIGLDVNMMVMVGGQERTEAEWAGVLDKAGYVKVKTHPTRSLFSVMEATPKA